jgi:aminopeptidase N
MNEEQPNRTSIKAKTIFILLFAVIFNLLVSYSLFAGAKYFTKKLAADKEQLSGLFTEKGFYIAEKIYDIYYKTKAPMQREDDAAALEYQRLIDVQAYDLDLNFDMEGKSISGNVSMTVHSLSDTLNFVYLNLFQNMKVSKVSVMKIDEKTGTEVSFIRENDYVIISLPTAEKKDHAFKLEVSYSGAPKSQGMDAFTFKEIYGSMVAYNLSEPNYAPAWWPCKDLPEDKAIPSMHYRVPRGYTAVTNGILVDSVQNADGTTTFNWTSIYPISTYLVSVVAAKLTYAHDTYVSLDGNKEMPVVYYTFPKDSAKARIDWAATPEMIGFLAKTFGEYPFLDEKYGMVEFGWTQGSMEHQTLTSYGYLLVTGDNRFDQVVIHELAHQWFGDAVTLLNWKNIWLNEGFATYCEALWEEYKGGKSALIANMKQNDYGYFSGTVYAPEGYIFSPSVYATVYQKGGWVLHMLRGVTGDETFFKIMRTYFERFKFKNAETKDFQAVAEEIYGQSLQDFFDQWVYTGKGRPKYEYSWKFEDFQDKQYEGAYTVRLQLNQVQDDMDVYKMPVKINVVTAAGSKEFTIYNDKREQSFLLSVDSKPKEVQIDRDGWILKKLAKGKYE